MIQISNKYEKEKKESKGSSGFLGISVGKKLFNNKNVIESYAKFASEHFSDFFFLIADLPKRFNIMALENIGEEDALKKVESAGKDTEVFISKIVNEYPNLSVIRWNEFCDSDYEYNLRVLYDAYEKDIEFRKAIENDVLEFLSIPGNQEKLRENKIGIKKALTKSVNYRIDELAILLAIPCKYESICEIYPGIDQLHERLQNKEFEFCEKLKLNPKRIFMEAYHGN